MSGGKSKNHYEPLAGPSRKRVAANRRDHKALFNRGVGVEKLDAARTEVTNLHTDRGHDLVEWTEPTEEPAQPSTKRSEQKRKEKTRELLKNEQWLARNGHVLTYIGLYLFSILVLFRPYELVPGLGFLSATAFYFALATLLIYLPSQVAVEGNLTMLSTEVKAILAMTLIAIATMPIAKDPGLAWERFNDPFIKAVVIFVVLVNVVRTRKRLMGMMWLSFGIAIYLSFAALDLYWKGQFNVEEYRVGVEVGGMFGNPNEMAMHLVMMTPIVIALGIASRVKVARFGYFGIAFLFEQSSPGKSAAVTASTSRLRRS
jgi:hypothetical protein